MSLSKIFVKTMDVSSRPSFTCAMVIGESAFRYQLQ